MLKAIQEYIIQNALRFEDIGAGRKKELLLLSNYINELLTAGRPVNLIYICSHNSRRSHMSQLWSQAAAYHYGIPEVHCYSGGTEATAFNHRAVNALQKAGFDISKTEESANPLYLVTYSETAQPIKAFSKTFSDEFNPQEGFAAIMTCSDADAACPFIPGADNRISIPYPDPKEADDTPEEAGSYDAGCRKIATEMFFVFSNSLLLASTASRL